MSDIQTTHPDAVSAIRERAEACELVYLTALAEQVVARDVPALCDRYTALRAALAALEQEMRAPGTTWSSLFWANRIAALLKETEPPR